jgi:hypothetical protein
MQADMPGAREIDPRLRAYENDPAGLPVPSSDNYAMAALRGDYS